MSRFKNLFASLLLVVVASTPVGAQSYGDWRPPTSQSEAPTYDSRVPRHNDPPNQSQRIAELPGNNSLTAAPSNSRFASGESDLSDGSWPSAPIGQTVHTTELEISENSHDFADGSLNGNEGEGDLVSKLKNGASEKISGLIGSIKTEGGWAETIKNQMAGADLQKMLGSLAVVLGGYFGFVWLLRKFNGGSTAIPQNVVNILGNVPFGPRQNLQLVRLGSKLLLLLNGPDGTHPIGEISDPAEVAHLTKMCPRGKTASSESFQTTFDRASSPPRPNAVVNQATANNRLPDVILPSSNPSQDSLQSELQRAVETLKQVANRTSSGNVFEA